MKIELDLKGRALIGGLLRKEVLKLENIIDDYKGDRSSETFKVLKSNYENARNVLNQFNHR